MEPPNLPAIASRADAQVQVKPKAPQIDAALWESHKQRICELYIQPKTSVRQIRDILATETNLSFMPTEKQYERQINKVWNLRKTLTRQDHHYVDHVKAKREMLGKVNTRTKLWGQKIEETERLKKKARLFDTQLERSKKLLESAPSPMTPEGLIVGTPTSLASPMSSRSDFEAENSSQSQAYSPASFALSPLNQVWSPSDDQQMMISSTHMDWNSMAMGNSMRRPPATFNIGTLGLPDPLTTSHSERILEAPSPFNSDRQVENEVKRLPITRNITPKHVYENKLQLGFYHNVGNIPKSELKKLTFSTYEVGAKFWPGSESYQEIPEIIRFLSESHVSQDWNTILNNNLQPYWNLIDNVEVTIEIFPFTQDGSPNHAGQQWVCCMDISTGFATHMDLGLYLLFEENHRKAWDVQRNHIRELLYFVPSESDVFVQKLLELSKSAINHTANYPIFSYLLDSSKDVSEPILNLYTSVKIANVVKHCPNCDGLHFIYIVSTKPNELNPGRMRLWITSIGARLILKREQKIGELKCLDPTIQVLRNRRSDATSLFSIDTARLKNIRYHDKSGTYVI